TRTRIPNGASPSWMRSFVWPPKAVSSTFPPSITPTTSAVKFRTKPSAPWSKLDGGINDVTVDGLLTPALAYQQGYVLATWRTWIRDQCRRVEESMVKTLEVAVELFPNATIVVNGYFPIFSHASAAH